MEQLHDHAEDSAPLRNKGSRRRWRLATMRVLVATLLVMLLVMTLALVGVCVGAAVSHPSSSSGRHTTRQDLNLYPIIGILSQELSKSMDNALQPHNYTSYIAASYVKFYESAGARVVPIMINEDEDYYRRVAASVNGLIFPGGGVSITNSSGYGRAGQLLFELAQQRDPPVPLMATCLGFEMLLYLASGGAEVLTKCKATNRADPLTLQPGWEESSLLGEAPLDVLETFTKANSTSNFHKKCITPQTFHSLGLDRDFRLLSTSTDDDGVEYVSTVEHRRLPMLGVQWHPEKNLFEWSFSSIPHEREAVRAVQYVANHFVDQARLNNQTFPTEEEEQNALIYNYCPIFTAPLYRSSFQQCYFFP